jgi:pimeloyl-ACP methyl ester carboxylesterase
MFIPHNNAQLYTVSFGQSLRTLVAIGGWAGSWEVWTETFVYLSETWRTVAYDHRGAGATIAPVDSITPENMLSDLFAILDALQIERCVLASESAGAVTALQAARQQPDRFEGLVLVGALYQRPHPTQTDPFVVGLQTNFENTLGNFVDACVPEPDSEAIRHWGRQILRRAEPAAAIQLYECLYGIDLRPQVSAIELPALILHGEQDRLVPLSAAQWLAVKMPQAHLQILTGAGHVPTVTRPRLVAEAINEFFKVVP